MIWFAIIVVSEPMELKKVTTTTETTSDPVTNTTTGGGSTSGDIEWISTIETVVTSTFDDFSLTTAPEIHNLTNGGFGVAFKADFTAGTTVAIPAGFFTTKEAGAAGKVSSYNSKTSTRKFSNFELQICQLSDILEIPLCYTILACLLLYKFVLC